MSMLKKLSGIIALLSVLFAFSSCSEDEKTYESFSVSIDTYAVISSEVVTYVNTRCAEFNKNELSTALEQKTAEERFNSFCGNLSKEVKDKGFKVFSGAWLKLQLSNLEQKVVAEKQVDFTQTATPKYYVQIIFKEIAPVGDTEKATQVIEENLQPFALTKNTETTEEGYTINTYSYYKEYTTYEQAKSYYDSKKGSLGTLVDEIAEEKLPSDLIYTSRLELTYSCVNEAISSVPSGSSSYVIHAPQIYKCKWVTTSEELSFKTIVFSAKKRDLAIPFFVSYGFKMDEQQSDYNVYRLGNQIVVMDANSNAKYRFKIEDADHIRVDRINGVDVVDGAVFSKEEN